jgi:hypothetical protein
MLHEEICQFYKSLKPHFSHSQAEEVEQALAICQGLDSDTLEAVRTLAMAAAHVGQEQIRKAIDGPKWPSISERNLNNDET